MADITLESVRVETPYDGDPDISHLGEFTDEPGPDDRTVDRGDGRYFVAAHSPEETGNPNSVQEDYERALRHARGEIGMRGVQAVAKLEAAGLPVTVRSHGLWGIASDSSGDYFEEVAREEVDALRPALEALGVDADEIDAEWASHALFHGDLWPPVFVEWATFGWFRPEMGQWIRMEISDLRRGQMIRVQKDRHDEPRDARVVELPPFDGPFDGTVTDAVLVEYPGTSLDGGKLFTDIQERVTADEIVDE